MFSRLFQCYNTCGTWVEVFHEPLDRASLACRISPFEYADNALPRLLDPVLYFQQLDLQFLFVLFIDGSLDSGLVGISAITE